MEPWKWKKENSNAVNLDGQYVKQRLSSWDPPIWSSLCTLGGFWSITLKAPWRSLEYNIKIIDFIIG